MRWRKWKCGRFLKAVYAKVGIWLQAPKMNLASMWSLLSGWFVNWEDIGLFVK